MVTMDKGIPQSQNVMFIPWVTLVVELGWGSRACSKNGYANGVPVPVS